MSLLNITSLEQANKILAAWWYRPGKILDLIKKHPEKVDKIMELYEDAFERKIFALRVVVWFRKNEFPEGAVGMQIRFKKIS